MFYRRYLDDIFLFKNEHQVLTFVDFLNSQHPNLSFTIEKGHLKQFSFWNFLSILSDRLITRVYKKLPVSIGKVHSQDFYRITIIFYIQERRREKND